MPVSAWVGPEKELERFKLPQLDLPLGLICPLGPVQNGILAEAGMSSAWDAGEASVGRLQRQVDVCLRRPMLCHLELSLVFWPVFEPTAILWLAGAPHRLLYLEHARPSLSC